MNTYAMDWELREGLALRVAEATAAAERERLVRRLRAARRCREAAQERRPRWWARRRRVERAALHGVPRP